MPEFKIEKIVGFLETEEEVREARINLEEQTKEKYEEFDEARRLAHVEAHKKLLD